MRIVVTGATGNVGTSVIAALREDPAVEEVVAIARRPAGIAEPRVRFVTADVARDDLDALFRGADAVIHLAWLIQPSRDDRQPHAVNVDGSRRVFEAAARAQVKALVHASSVGTYAPGPKDRAVDESWPATGIPTLFYSRHKAECERLLDLLEHEHPRMRIVRLRPGLIFKREAATGIRRLFAGPLLPGALLRKGLIPIVPDVPRLRFQAVHSLDVGEAYRLAATRDVRGAFNVAADPVIDPQVLGEVLGARPVPLRGASCARRPTSRGGSICSRRRRAGSTSRSACRSWTRRAPGPSWGGSRGAAPPRRWRSSSAGCATARTSPPRRSPRPRAGRCASASC
jgi:nucleoside-diphosphate-sugar epimerase